MAQLIPQQPPPPDYYAGNLRLLFAQVRDTYDDLLTDEEQDYIRAFMALSSDAQRLYARLLGRKGPWIRVDRLSYREIVDLPAAIAELEAGNLAILNGAAPADILLGLLTDKERRALFPGLPATRKAAWIQACVLRYADIRVRGRIATHTSWIELARYHLVHLCQLLYFGDDHQDTSTFVLQDLGVLRFESYALDRGRRLFADRAALDRYRRLRHLAGLSRRLRERSDLAPWLARILPGSSASRIEARQRDRVLNTLGHHFEREGAFDAALDCYGRSRLHPSRERRVRLLKRLDDACGARTLAERMGSAPRCSEEVDFARRFDRPRSTASHAVTEIRLTGATPRHIEEHAARRLAATGATVFHLENALPLGIAGLAFWDVIFADLPGAFTNPFQTAPLDLFWPDFAATRQAAIAARTAELSAPGALPAALEDTFRDKQGIANRLVFWQLFDESVLDAVVATIPPSALLALACHVIRWPYRTRTGFPDLTVLHAPGRYEFVEVKGPADQLQPGQRVWLDTLATLGQPARVMKFKAC